MNAFLQILKETVADKRVLLLGFGREGRSTFRTLKALSAHKSLAVADINAPQEFDFGDAAVFSGETYLDRLEDYDVVFKSPGIVLPKPAPDYACRVTTQTELFLRAFRSQVIGVTGTKGKSTVSTLLHHVLSVCRGDCLLAGNIGTPVFDVAELVTPRTVVVVELSCHQLEHCPVSPQAAVLLNLFEDHLDHYGTLALYHGAKRNIYRHQSALDTLWCGENALPDGDCASRVLVPDAANLPFASFEEAGAKLRGAHNLLNCAFVYAAAQSFGIGADAFSAALKTYRPLPHRLEPIGELDGVAYYDDSISTTVESALSAMKSIPNATTILLGGMDRGIDYTRLVESLRAGVIANVVLMYESGRRIAVMLEAAGGAPERVRVVLTADLAEAVRAAKALTPRDAACILSPAAASYGHFKNFEERGDAFRALVFDDAHTTKGGVAPSGLSHQRVN
ncbi:MAG: UDP-N-acetylmuramoyl-L-alanine--D-glutamate ligase [Oscillospiraceae bacterium]